MSVQTATIPFAGNVTAGSELTLVSPRISSPFTIFRTLVSFALNTNRTLKVKMFVSIDNSAPATGEPSGVNVLDEFGQANYLTGDDEQKEIFNQYTVKEGGAFVKMYAINSDAFDHTLDGIVEIDLQERT